LQSSPKLRNLPRCECPGWQFFHRAEGNAVCLAQGAIDGTGFGHAHLGMVEDQGRDIAGIGIAVAHKATALGALENRRFEHPEVLFGTTERDNRFSMNA